MPCLDDNALAALMGNTMSPAERAAAEAHIETCASCRQLVAAMLKGERDEKNLSNADTAPSVAPIEPAAGRTLGRYVLLDVIGAGGMGVVYAAYDPVLERKVALKLVRKERGPAPEIEERLMREGKSIAQLQHQNIVSVFDMGASDGQVYVAMELVGGGSLKKWLRDGPRPWREVLEKFIAAGEGLAAAHRAGIVHRDFKPENVLVGEDGRVRVTDFGLASSVGLVVDPAAASPGTLDVRLTQSGAVLGTPAYMAPEQHEAAQPDARSDQFSFCVALWEGLYGARPYAAGGKPSEPWRLVEPPASASVPPWVRRAVQRGLSLERGGRWPSMELLVDALRRDPARALKVRLATAAVALVVLAAAGGGTWWVATRGERLCSAGPERVAAVWSEPVAAAIGKNLTGETAASFERAKPRLDGWFKGWAELYGDACRATRVRGEQSDEVLSRRMLCLDQRFAEARALVQLFQNRDDGVLAKAPEAVDALGGLHGCSDTEALLAEVPPPSGEALAAQVEAVRTHVREAKARFDGGLYKEAQAAATEAVKLARDVAYKPVLAEALATLGRVQEHAGDLKGAEATLTEAISIAEAAKTDALTAEAATHLVLVLGVRQARYGEAHAWEKLAEGAIHRIGGSLPLQARLMQTSGLVHYQEGQLEQAIAAHQQAVELLEKLEPQSLALADAYSSLGAALRGGRKAKEAFAAFEKALEILRARVGPNSDLTATALNGVGSSLMLEGRFDEALDLYTQAHDVFVRRLGPTHFRTVTAVNNIGVVLAEQGRYADALPYFEKVVSAREATLAPTDAKTADALANVGMLLVEVGRYDDAQKSFEKARGILQGYPLDHFSQAEPLLGEAKVLIAKNEAAKAVPLLERVLKLCENKQGFRFDYTRARAQFVLGRALATDPKRGAEARALALAAREAFASFGAERFKRDLTEVDAWLAGPAAAPRAP